MLKTSYLDDLCSRSESDPGSKHDCSIFKILRIETYCDFNIMGSNLLFVALLVKFYTNLCFSLKVLGSDELSA